MTLAIHTARLRALVARLNTTRIGGIGFGTASIDAVTILGQGLIRSAISHVVAPQLGADAAAGMNTMLDAAVQSASTTLVPAIALAWAGRPLLPAASAAAPAPSILPSIDIPASVPISGTRGTGGTLSLAPQVARADADNGVRETSTTSTTPPDGAASSAPAALQGGKESNMANKFAGELADVIIAAAENPANKPRVLEAIQAAEGGVEGVILNAIKNAPKGNGLVALTLPIVETEVAAYVQQLVAKEGPEVVFDFLDGEAHVFAKSLGG